MKAPLVSVCIVTFNHEAYIHDCLMSVIEQADSTDIEILVGDDQSEDGTQAIAEALAAQYPDIIDYRRNAERLGPAGNYLSLIERSRGEYIAHLDGDDLWVPGKAAAQVEYLEKHPSCSAVYTNASTINDDGSRLGVFNNPQQESFNIDDMLARGNFLCHSSLLYRATLKDRVLALPAPFIDYRIHLLLVRHGDLGYINRHLVLYRVNSSSSMLVHANDNVRELYWEAIQSIPRDATSENALANCIAEFGRSVFFAALRKRNILLFRKWLPEIVNTSPIGRSKIIMLMITAIIRVGVQELFQALRSLFSNNHTRVLYRR